VNLPRLAPALLATLALAAPDPAQMQRGEALYTAKCAMCHQLNGAGAPPVFPPLAQSDWLKANREGAIKALCEGLEGVISVNGVRYDGVMPAQVLDDTETADVLTYATNSWGNSASAFTADEIRRVRATTRFKSYDELVKATAFAPLPQPPDGFSVREVAQLPEFCTRLATRGDGQPVYVLSQKGSVFLLDASAGTLLPVIRAADYLSGDVSAYGLHHAPDGRLYLVTNRRDNTKSPPENEVVVWRTAPLTDTTPAPPGRWLTVRYPWGIGPFTHGVGHIATGPDGMLYINSGSRTDAGEAGSDARYYQGGETDLTACLWRVDPRAEKPSVEVFARGIRNAWGFAWDGEGHLFTASNGPDADAPEELDFIQPGRHYGFPYQFADWPAQAGSPYPHTPAVPDGLVVTKAIRNFGPAAGGSPEKPIATFDPHSSPGGMIWCGDDWPAPLRHCFLLTRSGNLLPTPHDVGFDLLAVRLSRDDDGTWRASAHTILSPLGRPLDVIRTGPGRALILEYTRPTNFRERLGWLPGRVIELSTPTR
jgi:glucose/arabinose dehydrogenase/mono/diheme cytochrome c family protein